MLNMVHVRLLNENGTWIAQCLEYDITGHANTDEQAALKNLRQTIQGQILIDKKHDKLPLEDVRPAPFPYWLGIERPAFVALRIDLTDAEIAELLN